MQPTNYHEIVLLNFVFERQNATSFHLFREIQPLGKLIIIQCLSMEFIDHFELVVRSGFWNKNLEVK